MIATFFTLQTMIGLAASHTATSRRVVWEGNVWATPPPPPVRGGGGRGTGISRILSLDVVLTVGAGHSTTSLGYQSSMDYNLNHPGFRDLSAERPL